MSGQECSREGCANPAVPPGLWQLTLCFEHWCEHDGYVPTRTVERNGHPHVIAGDYRRRGNRDSDSTRRVVRSSLLVGAALRRYQERASEEGWLRDGGYWSPRAERVLCSGCGEQLPATITPNGRWWVVDDHEPCGSLKVCFEELRL